MQEETVTNLLEGWLVTYTKPPCKSENTYQCYKFAISVIKKVRPELTNMGLSDIDENYLQSLLNELAVHYSKSTLRKIRTVFKNAYSVAGRQGKCSTNPASSLTIPVEASEKEIRALTREEEVSVITAARKDILGHFTIFMLETGLRSSEFRNLKWSDYNPEKNEICIRKSKTKTGVRVVPLLAEAKQIIEAQPHYCDYIFTSTIKKPVTKTVLRKLYVRLRKATGIDIITNHVYRHSFATRAVEKEFDYKALSKVLGHKNVAFTLHRYTNAETSFLHEQMEKMEPRRNHPKKFRIVYSRIK